MYQLLSEYINSLPIVWFRIFLRYVIPSGLAYAALWIIFKAELSSRMTGKKEPGKSQLVEELTSSGVSIIIFGLLSALMEILKNHGVTKMYEDISAHGYLYFIFTVIVLIVGQDAYFYWTHRLMHTKYLKSFHMVHHRSVNCTPWAAQAFGVVETLVHGLFALIMIFILPIHLYALIIFVVHMVVFDVIGHSGFELFSKNWISNPLTRHRITSTYHSIHHRKYKKNYGLYFTWWDRWMQTEDSGYEAEFLKNAQDEIEFVKLGSSLISKTKNLAGVSVSLTTRRLQLYFRKSRLKSVFLLQSIALFLSK